MHAAIFFRQITAASASLWTACISGLIAISLQSVGAASATAADLCPTPVFGVHNVSIDQSAATATEAQILGSRAAAETAFSVLLKRLLNDQNIVDQFIDTHDLDEFTDFVHISEENSLEGRYIALLDYCFDPIRLRTAFRTADLNWAELPSSPILVVPVWKGPDGARAWQSDNEWLSGWRNAVEAATGLLSFTLLEPTITNERKLRAENLALADPVTLQKSAQIAGASQIMLVIAQLDYDGAQPILTVSGQLFSGQGDGLTQLGRMVDLQVNDDLSMQLTAARQEILQELEQSWHAANLISGNEARQLVLQVPVGSLAEWSSRLDVLNDIAVIGDVRIRRLTVGGGLVTLSLSGSMAALENALSHQKLQINMSDDGTGILLPVTVN